MRRSIAPTENHLKARFLNELRRTKRVRSSTIVANELPLGNTGLRADLALYSRHFVGVEIKSDRDSLKRLSRQLPTYLDYFDKTILVLGSKHWQEAMSLDLTGVELWIASGLSLKRVQPGAVISQATNQGLLASATLQKKYQKSHETSATKSLFLTAFTQRFHVKSREFWEATAGRPIAAEDLTLLSRFVDKREQAAALVKSARKSHENWLEALAQSVQASSVSIKDTSSS